MQGRNVCIKSLKIDCNGDWNEANLFDRVKRFDIDKTVEYNLTVDNYFPYAGVLVLARFYFGMNRMIRSIAGFGEPYCPHFRHVDREMNIEVVFCRNIHYQYLHRAA